MVVMVGLNSSCTTTFSSVSGNFHVTSLVFSLFHFLETIVKSVFAVVLTAIVAKKTEADMAKVLIRI